MYQTDVMNVRQNLKIVGWKKSHNILFHYNHVGGSRNQQLPIIVLRRGAILYFSLNSFQNKNDFYDEKIAHDFLNSVYERFVSGRNYKIHGYVEVVNYQQTEIVNLENTRVWLTNVFKGRHFIPYIRGEIKNDILRRVIINGATGSSWIFKRFSKLQIITTDESNFKNIMSGWYFFQPAKKMDFTEFEASEENTDNPPLVFSDDEDEIANDAMDNFIDDTDQQGEGVKGN